MPRSLPSKEEYAKQLLRIDVPYRDIQSILKTKYGSGLANTTLQRLKDETIDLDELYAELSELRKLIPLTEKNAELKKELNMFKKLYFELLETVNETLDEKRHTT